MDGCKIGHWDSVDEVLLDNSQWRLFCPPASSSLTPLPSGGQQEFDRFKIKYHEQLMLIAGYLALAETREEEEVKVDGEAPPTDTAQRDATERGTKKRRVGPRIPSHPRWVDTTWQDLSHVDLKFLISEYDDVKKLEISIMHEKNGKRAGLCVSKRKRKD